MEGGETNYLCVVGRRSIAVALIRGRQRNRNTGIGKGERETDDDEKEEENIHDNLRRKWSNGDDNQDEYCVTRF